MALPMGTSLQVSESLKHGDSTSSQSSSTSGQHGLIQNLQLGGKGNSQTPSFTDSSGNAKTWVWVVLGSLLAGLAVWIILRNR